MCVQLAPKHNMYPMLGMVRVVADRGPKDLDISKGHLVCLDNIGGFTDREALRNALYAKFPDLRVRRTATCCASNRPAGLLAPMCFQPGSP